MSSSMLAVALDPAAEVRLVELWDFRLAIASARGRWHSPAWLAAQRLTSDH